MICLKGTCFNKKKLVPKLFGAIQRALWSPIMVKKGGRIFLIESPILVNLRLSVQKLRKGCHTFGAPCILYIQMLYVSGQNVLLTRRRRLMESLLTSYSNEAANRLPIQQPVQGDSASRLRACSEHSSRFCRCAAISLHIFVYGFRNCFIFSLLMKSPVLGLSEREILKQECKLKSHTYMSSGLPKLKRPRLI